MKICTVANRKGGVGKSTLSLNIAARAHERGMKTLLVDLDAQGSASYAARGGDDSGLLRQSLVSVLASNDTPRPVRSVYGFDLLGSADVEIDTRALSKLRDLEYDFIVLDTAPAAGAEQSAALFAADTAVLVIEPDEFSVHGLQSLFVKLREVQRLKTLRTAIVVNRLRARCVEQMRTIVDLRGFVGDMLTGILGEREAVRRARAEDKAVWQYDRAVGAAWLTVCDKIIAGE